MLLSIATTLRIEKLKSFKRDDVGVKRANLWNMSGYVKFQARKYCYKKQRM